MIPRVAVVGGGVFGCVIAAELTELGLEVQLFEKNSSLLSGSTVESVSRLHLGLHYPRDIQTAKQSIEGFKDFVTEFPEAVDLDFTNYYALSSSNSRVTETEFREFAIESGAPFQEVEKGELAKFGFNIESVSALFFSPEGVISNEILRSTLNSRLASQGVNVRSAVEIGKVDRTQDSWRLFDKHGENYGNFNLVILATYALDNIEINSHFPLARREYEFQNTLVLAAKMPDVAGLGVTVMDGDFLTLLPVAFQTNHLIYAPGPSVLTRETGYQPSIVTNSVPSAMQLAAATEQIIQRLQLYFSEIDTPADLTLIPGKRAIEANVRQSDRRQTTILELGPSLYSVASGKIDHCFIAARQIRALLAR